MDRQSKEISNTKNYYNKNFSLWTTRKTDSFYFEKVFQKLVAFWPEKGSIIDIGCAYGIHVPLFLGIGRKLRYLGIDISTSFLKIASRRYPQLTFINADIANALSLPKQRFDGFMASAVLMHVPYSKWTTMFETIETIAKPKSYGYVTLPVAHPNATFVPEDNRHFTILSELEQRAFFKSRNWKIVKAGTLDGFATKQVWRWYIVQLP